MVGAVGGWDLRYMPTPSRPASQCAGPRTPAARRTLPAPPRTRTHAFCVPVVRELERRSAEGAGTRTW